MIDTDKMGKQLTVLAMCGKVIVGRSSMLEKKFHADMVAFRALDVECSVTADTPAEAIDKLYVKAALGQKE